MFRLCGILFARPMQVALGQLGRAGVSATAEQSRAGVSTTTSATAEQSRSQYVYDYDYDCDNKDYSAEPE